MVGSRILGKSLLHSFLTNNALIATPASFSRPASSFDMKAWLMNCALIVSVLYDIFLCSLERDNYYMGGLGSSNTLHIQAVTHFWVDGVSSRYRVTYRQISVALTTGHCKPTVQNGHRHARGPKSRAAKLETRAI